MKKLTSEQLGMLLHKSETQPRRNQKRYLKDLGCNGSAEELDQLLEFARSDHHALREAKRLDRHREITARTIEAGVDGRVAEMLAAIKVRMEWAEMSQEEMAESCGFSQPLINKYLTGKSEPGSRNLAKMAEALGYTWQLVPADGAAIINSWGTAKGTVALETKLPPTEENLELFAEIGMPAVYQSPDGFAAALDRDGCSVWHSLSVFKNQEDAERCAIDEFERRRRKDR